MRRKRVISAYFTDWSVYGRGYYVKDIPADKLNVIQYAFGVPTFDQATGAVGCSVLDPWADFQQVYWSGENTVDGVADAYPDQRLYGNFNQLRKLKAANPHLREKFRSAAGRSRRGFRRSPRLPRAGKLL